MAAPFCMPVRVYIEDTDAGGIVYYVNYLKYMERARTEWLRQYGLTQKELLDRGVQLVVHHLSCRYAKPARLDDELQVSAQVVERSACRLAFHQRVMARGEPLCEADVHIACVDATRLRPVRWPSALAEVLNG
ncbi:tol-pal system-associated acyl-CoA thioesterase [Modicisalibacter xianhensis]|uniref:4-hydroxybenzoyl-CoA thioesterase n=1 Tax=Modicisalibacter xianhensis TaxID=442341 RepID=A0A1I3CFX7_9GAMM|nr:tol-pal system-associated acyl-CoA thioesterase [Halomonas xianhensis]SFH73450.1 4-hydroxybenzoyl-CoA thioesterase [Halomonas xianhensis]